MINQDFISTGMVGWLTYSAQTRCARAATICPRPFPPPSVGAEAPRAAESTAT